MIYMQGDGLKVIILESVNLRMLKEGKPLKTPDGSVLIGWTPDIVWLANKILDTNGDAEAIGALMDEAAKRPEKSEHRSPHKPYVKRFDQK